MTADPAADPKDARKRVRYPTGMVLGTDDFEQEHAYLVGRDDWLARDAVGYGVLRGLGVEVRKRSDDIIEVAVAPGTAVTKRGRLVRVDAEQCASLTAWVAKQFPANAPASAGVAVTLRFRDCPTDRVLIPGEPCRTEAEATADSRLLDDFWLELVRVPPEPLQAEEDAVRKFAARLRGAKVVAVGGADLQKFLDAVTEKDNDLQLVPIPAGRVPEYIRAAFHVWVTTLRPTTEDADWFLPTTPADRERIVLARLTIPLTDGRVGVDPKAVTVDTTPRAELVHLRMLQEWLLGGGLVPPLPPTDLAGDANGPLDKTAVTGLREKPLPTLPPLLTTRVTSLLGYDGENWQFVPPAAVPTVPEAAGDANGPIDANVVTGLSGKPLPALPGLLDPQVTSLLGYDGENWRFVPPAAAPNVPAAADDVSDATRYGVATTPGVRSEFSRADHSHGSPPPLSGDVKGDDAGNTVLQGIQGRAIDLAGLAAGDVLQFDGAKWVRVPLPAGGPAGVPDNIVLHDPGTKKCEIVAAGNVRSDGSADGATMGGLALTRTPPRPGTGANVIPAILKFDGYKQPDGGFSYAVKITPWDIERAEGQGPFIAAVQLAEFLPEGDGIRLKITILPANGNEPPGNVRNFVVKLSVEVTRFGTF